MGVAKRGGGSEYINSGELTRLDVFFIKQKTRNTCWTDAKMKPFDMVHHDRCLSRMSVNDWKPAAKLFFQIPCPLNIQLLTHEEGGGLSTFFSQVNFENQLVSSPREGMGHFDFPLHLLYKFTQQAQDPGTSTPVTFPQFLPTTPGGGGDLVPKPVSHFEKRQQFKRLPPLPGEGTGQRQWYALDHPRKGFGLWWVRGAILHTRTRIGSGGWKGDVERGREGGGHERKARGVASRRGRETARQMERKGGGTGLLCRTLGGGGSRRHIPPQRNPSREEHPTNQGRPGPGSGGGGSDAG